MTDHGVGEQLIRDLRANPRAFFDDGRAYDLLQAYFKGFPLETLSPLLRSNDELVQRAAVFVVSELGDQAQSLLDDVIPLLRSKDRYLPYHAMEVLTSCCEGERASDFHHVLSKLESDDDVLRSLAMRLVSRADIFQLEAARRFFETQDERNQTHARALRTLSAGDRIEPGTVAAMMHDVDPLVRRYGAIAAKRLQQQFPDLIKESASSDDADLRNFAKTAVGDDES